MDFEEVLKKRRSIKKFKNRKVPQKLLEKIIILANSSPSAGNLQARSVIIVSDKKKIDEISKAYFYVRDWLSQVPMLLVILANLEESAKDYEERGRILYAIQDATIFASYLQLCATAEGLSTRWVGAFDEEGVRKIFKIPKDKRPIILMPIGYSDETPKFKDRKKIEEIIIKN